MNTLKTLKSIFLLRVIGKVWHPWEVREKIVTAMQGTLKFEAEFWCKIIIPLWYNKLHSVASHGCNQNLRYTLSVILFAQSYFLLTVLHEVNLFSCWSKAIEWNVDL